MWHPKREGGQSLAEYALLLTLIALAVVVILGVFGQELVELFRVIYCEVYGAVNATTTCPI